MAQPSRAALFGSHFHDWCCNKNKAPVPIERRFAFLTPPPAGKIARHLEQTVTPAPRFCAAASKVQAVQASAPAEAKRFLQEKTENDYLKVKCPCCREYLRTAEQRNEPIAVRPIKHAYKVDFDTTTWTTTATEDVVCNLTNANLAGPEIRQRLDAVYYFASPENWQVGAELFKDSDADPFFTASIPGYMEEGRFVPATRTRAKKRSAKPFLEIDPLEPWTTPGAVLKEEADWDWNDDNSSTSTVILEVTNYELYADDIEEGLKYNYVLHHCVKCEIGSVRYGNIIDVDGGSYQAHYNHATGDLHVSGSKSLHFTSNRGRTDNDLVALLNLLSPALIGMLMRELVHEGTIKVLNKRELPKARLKAKHRVATEALPQESDPPSLPASRVRFVRDSRPPKPPPGIDENVMVNGHG